uniref:Purinergic receptor P2X 4 n=1 Tax=Panthera leo TaxID=9689 RepID=A0A8C9D3J2_PANLE
MAGCCAALAAFLFEYDTPRIVLIRSRKVGLMNRAVQVLILAYVIGWVFVWEKGYQEMDSVVSSVTTKAKGVTVTNTSTLGFRVWDVADYVIPAQEENSLFIMTNMITTVNQTQGLCPELPDKTTVCKSDANCAAGSSGTHSNGIATGRCVLFNETVKTCEVAAWCPVEDDTHVPEPAFLKAAENFTLLVKNNIWYPKFNFSKMGPEESLLSLLTTCREVSWVSRSTGIATWTEPPPSACPGTPSAAWTPGMWTTMCPPATISGRRELGAWFSCVGGWRATVPGSLPSGGIRAHQRPALRQPLRAGGEVCTRVFLVDLVPTVSWPMRASCAPSYFRNHVEGRLGGSVG